MKFILLLLFLLLNICQAYSQSFSVSGTVQSAVDESTFPGATVVLQNPSDSARVAGVVTNLNGTFLLKRVPAGKYILQVRFVGFDPLSRAIDVQQDLDLGTLSLQEEATSLKEVIVVGNRIVGEQKGDTTQFSPGAFKTLQDASAQKLVEKMPGINLLDGRIQAQGEDVQEILIDGKPFFGNDVQAALQSLPAEVIASVQVFDRLSDKARLSGFDDGERIKTINIITKPNRRKGQFGKATVGYGTDNRYLLGGSVNFFNEDRRITVTGLSNNINALDYSADPNSQGETRTQNGIITTNILGLNFSDEWGEKIALTGSYLFSHRENVGTAQLSRDYVLSDSGQVYTEDNYNTSINIDHRLDMRFEYNIDSSNRIIIKPEITLLNDRNNSYFLGRTVTDNGPLNQTENTLNSDNLDYNFENEIYYGHQFRKKGRSFTIGLETGYYSNEDEANRVAQNIYYSGEDREELLNQQTFRNRTAFSWETDLSYTEPLGSRGLVELEYEIGNKINDSEKLTYNLYEEEEPFRQYSLLDTALSNVFNSGYLKQEVEIGYQYSTKKIRLQLEGEYQQANLQNEQAFPQTFELQRTFKSFLPTFRFDYKFSKSKKLEIDYDTRTEAPSIGQLQAVIDNSNPLHLRTGNPALEQSYRNRIRARYRATNPETNHTIFVYAATSIVANDIASSSIIAQEPTELADGIILEKGSQLSRPVNVDGYRELRSYVSYGQPLGFIKSNININGAFSYSERPGLINNEINSVNSGNFRLGLALSSNISETIDFNIYTRSRYSVVKNSLRPVLNNNYFNQSTRLSFDWIFWEGFTYRLDLNHQLNRGLAEGYDNSFMLLNMSLGKKFLQQERAEVSLHVYDLLGQNNNVRRNITEIYVEDRQSNVLQRYFMLTLTYNLRHFSKGTTMEDYNELHD